MIFIAFFISVLFLFLSYIKYRDLYNPYIAFNLLWTIVFGLCSVGNEYIYEPYDDAKYCVFLGVVAYNLSIYLPKIKIKNLNNIFNNISKRDINFTYINILAFFILIFSIIESKGAIGILESGGQLSDVRVSYYSYDSDSSILLSYFNKYVISPLRYLLIVSTIIGFFNQQRINKFLMLNCAGIVLLQTITSGGRYLLMNIFFMCICAFMIFSRNYMVSYKKKFIIFLSSVVILMSIIYVTNIRATALSSDMSTWERLYLTIYQYFVGSITYLGVVTESWPFIVGSTLGINFIAGFVTPIFAFLTFTGLVPYPEMLKIIGKYACEVMRIGDNSYYNAIPTVFGYFYIDGGLFLTFVESLLFGYICKMTYMRVNEKNIVFIFFYILLYMQVCNMSTRWFFYTPDYALAFLYVYIFVKYFCKNNIEVVKRR